MTSFLVAVDWLRSVDARRVQVWTRAEGDVRHPRRSKVTKEVVLPLQERFVPLVVLEFHGERVAHGLVFPMRLLTVLYR